MENVINKLNLDEKSMKRFTDIKDPEHLKENLIQLESELDKELNNVKNYNDQLIIDTLHKYNGIKDISEILIQSLARVQKVTVKKIYEDLGLEEDD